MLNHNVAWRGGTFFRALHLGRFLTKLGHQVTLVSISPRRRMGFDSSWYDGVRIVESPDLAWGVARSGWDLWDALNRLLATHRQPWDLVHAFDSRPAVVLPALALRRRGVPMVMDWADWWGRGGTQSERPGSFAKRLYGPIETYFEEAFRAQADGTTVVSELLRDRALSLGVRLDQIRIVPGGSEPDDLPASAEVQKSSFLVGYVGAATVRDCDLLFNGLRHAASKVPDLRLLAVGASIAGSRTPFASHVPPDMKPRVIDVGRVPHTEVQAQLRRCQVLVLPMANSLANRARWPSRVNDYLAAGRPIVATAVSDAQQLFASDIGALVPDSPVELGEALSWILVDQPEAVRMGAEARKIADGRLHWRTIAAEVDAFYRTLAL